MKLEEMAAFFEARLDGYEQHMLQNIASAAEFYPFTAACLPDAPGAAVLDLGCGTGLELRWYFDRNPSAKVTGIDLSQAMLAQLRRNFPDPDLTLICGSYFDVPLGEGVFDAALSVESLHHFTQAEKNILYTKLRRAMKPGGCFVLTDYFALSDEEESAHRAEFLRLKAMQNVGDQLCHFDTPLTVAHETEALLQAGFDSVQVAGSWGATHTLVAVTGQTGIQSPAEPE